MIAKNTQHVRSNALAGLYFHSIKDGKVHWQGHVIGSPEPGWYVVMTYSWVLGEEYAAYLVPFEEMKDWLFYETAELFHFSYKDGAASKMRWAAKEVAE